MTPATPPIVHSVTASMRNCTSMSLALAPTARRSPISRVRSVTDTNMMFMMPMPPTSNDTDATAANSMLKTCEASARVSIISDMLRM